MTSLLNKIHNWFHPRHFVITAVNVGGALEWYEIGLFISWPLIILQRSDLLEQSLIDSLNSVIMLIVGITLASGVTRGLGGWFFGWEGDRKGRKGAFALSILLSSVPSLIVPLISFFIPYKSWDTYATIIFAIIKLFQGFPAGGEFPGAICFLSEAANIYHDSPSWISRRYLCSYTILGPQLGLMLSVIVCLFLKSLFPIEFLLHEGWRFAFLFSGLLGILGFFVRNKLHETPAFEKLAYNEIASHPMREVFSKYLPQVIFGFTISIFETVLFIVITLTPLFYSKIPFSLSNTEITYFSLASAFLRSIFLVVVAHLLVKFKDFAWLKTSAWGLFVLSFLLYLTFIKGSLIFSILINIAIIFLYSVQGAILPSLLAELFPIHVRYTGIAFSFNICDAVLLTLITSACYIFILKSSASFIFFIPISAIIFLVSIQSKLATKPYYK